MTKEQLLEKYKGGISVYDDEDGMRVTWLTFAENTSDDLLHLISYDDNMYGLPNISKWRSKAWAKTNIEKCLSVIQDNIEVWMDDVCVKEKNNDVPEIKV